MRFVNLEVLDYEGPTTWRWRLTDEPGGKFLADHDVQLDPKTAEYEAFIDLGAYLRRYAAPDRRLASEAKLLGRVGRWIGEQVLGPVGPEIVTRRPVTVRLCLPADARLLGYRPLELAHVAGRPLALQWASFVVQPAGAGLVAGGSSPVGERLRMLAVFSQPTDESALNLRRERYELARLIQRIAAINGKAIELRVLQYGVTRERLKGVLKEGDGWDVVHISGHGLPAGLLLEKADGRRDRISSLELVDLLELGAEQIKLVTMSSCDSAAVTAAEHLRLLGINQPAPTLDADSEPDTPLPALASELTRRLNCAVLAMRYPVADDFAIGLGGELYDLVLGKGQPLPGALQLALPTLIANPPTLAVPPLSVATPALFGSLAAELRLLPPDGGPLVFDSANVKLAYFPPEPKRFVGRVGTMARATAALAPESGFSGVLFHGMAEAGKTACALELAYGHEQGFAWLVWHKAPDKGRGIAAALTSLALDLECQLPGLKLVQLIDDQAALTAFLPKLTEFLKQSRILIVLDNVESLLSDRGDWRDRRWGLLVDALVGHDGLSRVILTSRRRPQTLDNRVLVEAIHALPLAESVLIARDLPNLSKLLDGTAGIDEAAGRALLAPTLRVVQGHPKLIELADDQGADPAALKDRLDKAERARVAGDAWLKAFFKKGKAAATKNDCLRALTDWTRATAEALSESAQRLFWFLCALEEHDQLEDVVDVNWTSFWKLQWSDDQLPDLQATLAPLVYHGLVAIEASDEQKQAIYRLHPAVTEAGRAAAGLDFQKAVDTALAVYWKKVFDEALKQQAKGKVWLMLRAGRSAAPYLLRLGDWDAADRVIATVLDRDSSPDSVAVLLPLLRRISKATKGTKQELEHGRTLARALAHVQPAEAESQLHELLGKAITGKHFDTASGLALDLIKLLRNAGRLDEALRLAEQNKDYTRLACLGPWTQLVADGRQLQILALQGQSKAVLTAVEALCGRIATLPQNSVTREAAASWEARELILDVGRCTALDLEKWEKALAFNAEIIKSKCNRNATLLEVHRTRFNDYYPLLRLGDLQEARALLLACRTVFEHNHAVDVLGKVLSALAEVEDELGHHQIAIQLAEDALRYKYIVEDPEAIAVSHFNLANYLQQAGTNPDVALANRLAAAVIRFQTGSGALRPTLRDLNLHLATFGADLPLPASFTQLCGLVDQVDGVQFEQLVERLRKQAADGKSTRADVLRLTRELPTDEVFDSAQNLEAWAWVIASIAAVEQALGTKAEQGDWVALIERLRRILAGERGEDLLDGLDTVDTAILQRTLDVLAGRVQLDPSAVRQDRNRVTQQIDQ